MLPRPAEGSWGLAESAARGRTRAEKEKQRKEVVCRELCAEIISVCVSRLGLDAAVGAWATFPGRGEVPCERGCGSWPCSTAFSWGDKALLTESSSHLWISSPSPRRWSSAGGTPKPSPGGCTHHCGLPRLQWVSCTPQLGHSCGHQCVTYLGSLGKAGALSTHSTSLVLLALPSWGPLGC